jgi:DNA (cytosine-5)-methyltransferase 1
VGVQINNMGSSQNGRRVGVRKENRVNNQEAERPMSGNSGQLRIECGRLRIGSCFSGIGGIEYGLQLAGLGPVVYQVEVDAFCRDVLEEHWPEAERHEDIRDVDPLTLPQCDVLVGGFPCQDVSVANTCARTGLSGSRSGLWSHMVRIAEATGPEWIVVENVAHGASSWLPGVRGDLERLGYASLPVSLEARALGGSHIRRRVFVLAHRDGFAVRQHEQRGAAGRADEVRDAREEEPVEPRSGAGWEPLGDICDEADGLPRGMAGTVYRSLGNSVVPAGAEVIGNMICELVEAGAQAGARE